MNKRLNIEPIVSSGYRTIKSGKAYDAYFPKANANEKTIVSDKSAEVEDVVRLMQKVVWKYRKDTLQIASILKGRNLEESITNIWEFLYHHIQYKLDTSGLEELRRPARLWSDRQGDCDDYAITASSMLTNLNIPHAFRITKYDKMYFQHVYVIIPHSKGHYVIDPVLSRSNYEKPFTDKKDFHMNLNGINVAVLEGFGNTSGQAFVNDLLFDEELEGLGRLSDQEADEKLYKYLVNTRSFVLENPKSVALYENPEAFIKMLDYAIKYWHTSKREEALSILVKNEENFNLQNGLSGLEEDEDLDESWNELDGLSNAEIVQYLRDYENPQINGLGLFKKWRKKFKKKAKNFWGKVKKGIKKVGKAIVRYNPASIAVRNGFLLAMKLNAFKYAQRLKWGYASKEQIKGKISEAYWNKSKKTLAAVRKIFVKKLQGKDGALKKAILKGKSGGLKGLSDAYFSQDSVDGLGAVASATLIAAASAVLAVVGNLMKKNKLGKEEQPVVSSASTQSNYPTNYPSNSPNSNVPANYSDSSGTAAQQNNPAYATEAYGNSPQKAGFMSHIKNNPLMGILGLGVLSGLIYMGYSSMQGQKAKARSTKAILSGIKTKKTKKTKKGKTQALKIEKLK